MKYEISLEEIMKKIRLKIYDEKYDFVVSINRGGLLPGYLISKYLSVPLEQITLNLRDENHKKIRDIPLLLKKINFSVKNKNILLVDDIVNSSTTMNFAKKLLEEANSIKTVVIFGNADISLFGVHNECIIWPWER